MHASPLHSITVADTDESFSPPSAFALAWRQTLRDFRAGELRLLLVAVTLAVGALTAVGFFADRLERSLARDARQLLGGDAIVSSDRPTPQAFIDEARARGLQVATTTGFPSMGRAAEPWEVANVIVFLASDLSSYLTGEVLSVSSQHP